MHEHDITEQAFKNGYEKGKQDVAKEIINKLIKTLDDNEFPYRDSGFWVVDCDLLTDLIREFKQKYIGE